MASLRTYLITRILLTLPMIFLLLTTVFLVMRVLPSDPVTVILGEKATEAQKEQMREQLGLNKHIIVQYLDYLASLLRGDLGRSLIWGHRRVTSEIMDRFPATLELAISSFIVSILIGLATGALSSLKKGKAVDYVLRIYGIVSYSLFIPWFGMLLQLFFGVYLRVLPVAGRVKPLLTPERITGLYVLDSILTLNVQSLVSTIIYLILPSLTLGIMLSGIYTRLSRASFIEVLGQDFITAAKARGLSDLHIFSKHVIKNAFIPILTMMGLQFAMLLAGAVLTETTFSWPGIGTFLVERIQYRDYTTVQGTIVFYAIFVALLSLVIDIVYAYIDPRIRY